MHIQRLASQGAVRRLNMQRSSSEGSIGARSDVWNREFADDGRVYYFNRATGASQWNLPNELYTNQFFQDKLTKATGLKGSSSFLGSTGSRLISGPRSVVMMPGYAKASRKVDCITESFMTQEEEPEDDDIGPCMSGKSSMRLQRIKLATSSCLRVLIQSARGLRDADFMPGVDKSDPYCVCEISGRMDSCTKTKVIDDDLDPVWEHEGTLRPFSLGDTLEFTVWDYDPPLEAGMAAAVAAYDNADDKLGFVTLSVKEALAHPGPIELWLEDAGDDIDAYLTVEVTGPCTAWPEMVGMTQEEALDALEFSHPDLSPEVVEVVPDGETYSVQSWESHLSLAGFTKNYFGALDSDARQMQPGDLVEVFPNLRFTKGTILGDKRRNKKLTFSHLGPPVSQQVVSHQKKRASLVDVKMRYIYFKEDLGSKVIEGAQWRRIPRKAAAGYYPERVVVNVDAKTKTVLTLPRNG